MLLLSAVLIQQTIHCQTIKQNNRIEILFLGDFDFGESYQTNPKYNRGVNILEKYGYDYMFGNIGSLLKNSDLAIANLETPFLPDTIPYVNPRKPIIHWSNADSTIKYLLKYNITALSLGNNHTFDCGLSGLNYTIKSLKENKLDCFGAGLNKEESSKPLIKQFAIGNETVTIAVISGFEYRKSYDNDYNYYAGENKPGVNVISVNKISEQIKEIRSKYNNAYIIFFPHWGKNYFWKTEKQTETAHEVIDAGADIIIGHGAHMMQEAEYYNNKWIIYSIGNAIFNSPGRYKSNNVKPYSFIAGLVFRNEDGDKEKHLRLYPLYTDNLETGYKVRYLDNEEIIDCYNLLKEKCIDKKYFNDEFRIKEYEGTQFFEIQLK